MRLESVRVINFKSIADSGVLPLGPVTVLVGANNSGKSAFVQALYSLQAGSNHRPSAVRVGAATYRVELVASHMTQAPVWPVHFEDAKITFSRKGSSTSTNVRPIPQGGGTTFDGLISSNEPNAYFYPQLAKRRVQDYRRDVSRENAMSIQPSWSNLVSRLQRLANPDFPGSSEYRDACEKILGFVVTVFPSENGQQAGRYVDSHTTIPLEEMGEGVSVVAAALAELAVARDKMFLFEEPENDLHPTALKQLLALMLKAAEHNQLIVTTHSNIVLKHLGAHPGARVVKVEADPAELPPTSVFTVIDNSPDSRIGLLRELGYELQDLDLFDAWLILEESSAERLIREYLVKWFTPGLVGRLRTVAAGGTNRMEAYFDDFHRLFLYAHLQEQMRGRAWVAVDGDPSGLQVVEQLRAKFGTSWPQDHFIAWQESDFERYYPTRFATRVEEVLALTGVAKRDAKRQLLLDVCQWADESPMEAQEAFADSAREVIECLGRIEAVVTS